MSLISESHTQVPEKRDLPELTCGCDYWPLIPDGSYMARCVDFNYGSFGGKTRKLLLIFEINDMLNPRYNGVRLFRAYNIPNDGCLRPGHHYYKDWVKIRGGGPPSRNARMSEKMFLNQTFFVRTRTVKKGANGKDLPEDFWYSVVDCIEEVVK